MIKLSEISNSYVFIHTSNAEIIAKVEGLTAGLHFEQFEADNQENIKSGVFYEKSFKAGKNTFFSIDKMNDLGDYELDKFNFNLSHKLDNQFDSLISYCFINEKEFVAGNDYLAIFNHFFYKDQNTFICSNNVFTVAKLCNDSVSEEALFETLFFRFPYKKGSFFKNVQALKPYQQLLFSKEKGLKLSSSAKYEDLILNDESGITESTNLFFSQLKNPDKLKPLVTLSGGSDSTTILSILKKNKFEVQLASFKGHNDNDTERIQKLAKKTGFPYTFIDADKYGNSIEDELSYSFLSNGLSPSIHFYHFYKNLSEKYQIFDGYSVMLGDWSEAFLNFPYREVIKGIPIETVLQKHFSAFHPDFLKKMKTYLLDSYSGQFINVNSPEGLQKIRDYSFEFIPSKILSRVYKCNTNFGHLNVSFFQSRKFISFIHKNKFGIAATVSARLDYPGYIKNRLPLGIIAHNMDKKINRLPLSYGLSLNDMYGKNRFILVKKRLYSLRKKLYYLRHEKPSKPMPSLKFDSADFDFILPEAKLSFHTMRELSLFNSVNSIMKKETL